MNRLITFLKEVKNELSKVSWPSRRQLTVYTGVVLGLCLFFAIYLGGIDLVLTWAVGRFVN